MRSPSTIKTEVHPGEACVTLLLNGKFGEESLQALEQSIGEARLANCRIYIDLSEVTLVDRRLVRYISDQANQGITVVNCPIYLRRWITQVPDDIQQ
jgi:anti-anti-sigma regulatory factor